MTVSLPRADGTDRRSDPRPLVLHVMYRFDTGGLENGVVNLINHMPADRYRHAILALTEVTDFRHRIQRDDVECFALNKPPGQGFWLYPQLYRLFRELRPAVVHSRNLAALEVQLPAWLARVPVRIHGEHGRDVGDLDGRNRTYQRVRRFYRPFVSHYIALSRDLGDYLTGPIGVPADRVSQFVNGVDTERFSTYAGGATERLPQPIAGCPFDPRCHWIVGTVGRMQAVKDQLMLTRAFILTVHAAPELRERLRLVMVGDGPLRAQCQALLDEAGMTDLAWLPGERSDVPAVMRGLHVFALPSLAEGISNTILEAMASGLPVAATEVGGNADLVTPQITGLLVAAGDPQPMAGALLRLVRNPAQAAAMGEAGRQRVERDFSMRAMVARYQGLYDRLRGQSPASGH
ncbi:TIGR03088 family PEP-CTERM/XrtA system glycosyltransferase [Roseateles depolymerans]|uniref:Sugar transferase n=1 Tax=Roseateles depolymerans TaxID=76731 RepID=A0A0U3N232_9BURK|nr:TIGR03088 family PEP-CTERM/XrtA system glycosyltransferase [Roseateles depolymerans]ALV06299.1 sugar transferase [Roseateles depolymerans]REG19269.1 sugar transferase (PEP-CTERM/EpsH1 system associated) [Roseateles depolymerans]